MKPQDISKTQADFAEHSDDKIWVHYTNLPQVTINPKAMHQDPVGIYLFPSNFNPASYWLAHLYRFDVQLDPSLQVLDLGHLSLEDAKEILDHLKIPSEDLDSIREFWERMRNHFILKIHNPGPGAWNKALRGLGYDAVFDDTKVIHSAEQQLLVLDPKKIKVLQRTDLKDTGFEDVVKVMDRVKELVSPYGKVEVTNPRVKTQYRVKTLAGEIHVYDGAKPYTGHYATWKVYPQGEAGKAARSTEINVSYQGGSHDFGYGMGCEVQRFSHGDKKSLDMKELDLDIKKAMDEIWAGRAVESQVDFITQAHYNRGQLWNSENSQKMKPTNSWTKNSFKSRTFPQTNPEKKLGANTRICSKTLNPTSNDMGKKTTILSSLDIGGISLKCSPLLPIPDLKGLHKTKLTPELLTWHRNKFLEAWKSLNLAQLDLCQVQSKRVKNPVYVNPNCIKGFFRIKIPNNIFRLFVKGTYIKKTKHLDITEIICLKIRYDDTYEDFKNKASILASKTYTCDEVIDFLSSIAPDDDLDNQYYDIGAHPTWELKKVRISDLDFEQSNCSTPESKELVKKYKKLKTKAPPIIVVPQEEGLLRIVDGYHRTAVADLKGQDSILAYVPVQEEDEADACVEGASAGAVQQCREMAESLAKEFFPELKMPTIKVVNQARAPWLGRAEMSHSFPLPVVKIQESVLKDPVTLERVLAHELIHCLMYEMEPTYVEFFKTSDIQTHRRLRYELQDGHGEFFEAWAAKVNQKRGSDFVNKTSDESYVLEKSTKDFFILIEKHRNGDLSYSSFLRYSPQIKKEIARRQESGEARLFKINDPSFLAQKPLGKYGVGRYLPNDPERKQKLKELFESETPVEVAAGLNTEASLEDGFEETNYEADLYHGSVTPVKDFKVSQGMGQFGTGLYLTPEKEIAEFFARGGRQGRSGQRPNAEPGHVYAFHVQGRGIRITDENEFYRYLISDWEPAEEAFEKCGDTESKSVTRTLSAWARAQGYDLVVFDPIEKSVLTPFPQVLVLNQKAIRKQVQAADQDLDKCSKINADYLTDAFTQNAGIMGSEWIKKNSSKKPCKSSTTEKKNSSSKALIQSGLKKSDLKSRRLSLNYLDLSLLQQIPIETRDKFELWINRGSNPEVEPVAEVEIVNDIQAIVCRARVDDSPWRLEFSAWSYSNFDNLVLEFMRVVDKRIHTYSTSVLAENLKTEAALCIEAAFLQELNARFAAAMRDKKVQKLILSDSQNWREIPEGTQAAQKEFILDRAFGEDYPRWMDALEAVADVDANSIILYRGISAASPSDINLTRLGVYWTWNHHKAKNYSGFNTDKPVWIVRAQVPFDAIDFGKTLRKLVWRGYDLFEMECEFELKPRSRLEILDILDDAAENPVEMELPEQAKAATVSSEEAPELINFQKLGEGKEALLESFCDLWHKANLQVNDQIPMFGYVQDGEVIAGITAEQDGGMFSLAVRTGYKQQGYARKLLEALIQYGKQRGWFFLACDAVHPVTRYLAKALGFSHEGKDRWFLNLEEGASRPEATASVDQKDLDSAINQFMSLVSDKDWFDFSDRFDAEFEATPSCQVTPEQARKFHRVHDMSFKDDPWKGSHQTEEPGELGPSLVLEISGQHYVLDGQHRLNRAIQAGQPATVVLVNGDWMADYGVTPEALNQRFRVTSGVQELDNRPELKHQYLVDEFGSESDKMGNVWNTATTPKCMKSSTNSLTKNLKAGFRPLPPSSSKQQCSNTAIPLSPALARKHSTLTSLKSRIVYLGNWRQVRAEVKKYFYEESKASAFSSEAVARLSETQHLVLHWIGEGEVNPDFLEQVGNSLKFCRYNPENGSIFRIFFSCAESEGDLYLRFEEIFDDHDYKRIKEKYGVQGFLEREDPATSMGNVWNGTSTTPKCMKKLSSSLNEKLKAGFRPSPQSSSSRPLSTARTPSSPTLARRNTTLSSLKSKGVFLGDRIQGSLDEDEEDEIPADLKSIKDLEPLRAELARAAQSVYDDWSTDEHGNIWCRSQEGPGGICHLIADDIINVLSQHGFECTSYSHDTRVHVSTFVKTREGLVEVDIDPYLYETGGGYNWAKIPDVTIGPDDISIHVINQDWKAFDEFSEFSEGAVESSTEYHDEGHVGDHWGSQASGVLFLCEDRVLLLYRSPGVLDPNCWGIPGGAVPVDQAGNPKDIKQSALDEAEEEMGGLPQHLDTGKKTVFKKGKFKFTTFLIEVAEEFSPVLNWENTDARWFPLEDLPGDIHPGVKWSIGKLFGSWPSGGGEKIEAKTLYHGTKQDFEKLEPNSDRIVWLAEDPEAAKRYQHYYHPGPGRLLKVELSDSAKVLDLRDVKNPTTQEYKKQYELSQSGMHGMGWEIPDERWAESYAHYGVLEQLGVGMAKDAGYDAVVVKDASGELIVLPPASTEIA